MNKKIALTASLFATSIASTTTFAAGTFETWNGADENVTERIQTGLGNQTETQGLWFDYTDADNGGRSKYGCPFEIDPHFIYCDTDGLLMECEGFCGTAILDKGTMTSNPYIGFGFNIVGETSSTDYTLLAGDASTWGGLCVTYTSDADLQLELGLGPIVDSTISYANPAVTLPAAKAPNILRATENKNHGNKVVVSWSDFKQPSWYNGSVKIDGETAAKQLAAVHFKIQAEPGDYNFNICAIGPKDGTCPEKCGMSSAGIQIVRGTFAIKAILNGRTLGFTGIQSTATVEVLNSLGQVVMKGAINNATTLNLAHLETGTYLLRISGKSVNFTDKIVLK